MSEATADGAPRSSQRRAEPVGDRVTWDGASDGDEGVLAEAAVVEIPTGGDGESACVSLAQVVGVRVTLGCQLVQPDLRTPVVVGQRDRGAFRASAP